MRYFSWFVVLAVLLGCGSFQLAPMFDPDARQYECDYSECGSDCTEFHGESCLPTSSISFFNRAIAESACEKCKEVCKAEREAKKAEREALRAAKKKERDAKRIEKAQESLKKAQERLNKAQDKANE